MWKVKPNPKIEGMASIWVDGKCLIPFIPIAYAEKIVDAIEKAARINSL